MLTIRSALLTSCFALPLVGPVGGNAAAQLPRGMVRIEAGSFRPLYTQGSAKIVRVKRFALDTVPVSLASYEQFVRSNPEWVPGRVPSVFADEGYLKTSAAHAGASRRPVTNVSWFAAVTYCGSRGARLPTTYEWEYVARASENDRNAAAKSGFRQRTLELALAAEPSTFLIGSGFRNVWGIRDLHGGLTEWTLDFGAVFEAHSHAHAHARASTCASGTVQTGAANDYAAFLRYAFRAAASARATAPNLGFRCALSLPPEIVRY